MPLPDHIGYADLYEVAPTSAIDRSGVKPLNEWMEMLLSGGSALLISAIDPPTPDPTVDGTQWYDPSTGEINVWYNGVWVPLNSPAPSSPTPLTGQAATVSVGGAAILVKRLDLPVPYFDGGQSYYSHFPNAYAAGWSSPDFFPFAVFYSPSRPPHADNLVAAGITHYEALEKYPGNVAYALAAGLAINAQPGEWSVDEIDAENGDNNPLVTGWFCDDEPDLFRDLYSLQSVVATVTAYNDGRFTRANFANGIIGTQFAAGTIDDMVQTVDVASVDQYYYSSDGVRLNAIQSPYWPGPGISTAEAKRAGAYGWLADRMKVQQAADEKKPFYVFVETARPLNFFSVEIDGPWITLPQITGAAWSAIRHDARGVAFFQHNNNGVDPFYSISDDDSTVIRGHITALTAEVSALAAVIDGPTYEWNFGAADCDTMLKAYGDDAYIFAGVALLAPLAGGGESDIEQTGTTLQFQITDTADSGTVSSSITVPDDAELVVVAVSGQHGTAVGFDAMTFTKGGVDTAMTKATGGDASGASWQSAMFYLDLPDTGASKTLKWNWLGAASNGSMVFAVTFWRGIDLNQPVRDSNGVQDTSFPLESPTLVETPAIAAANGDKLLAFTGMYNVLGGGSAKVNVWHHATALLELTHNGVAEGALATGTPDGDCTVGFENISVATQAAVTAATLKAATLEAVSSTVVQTGTAHTTTFGGSANSGTFFLPATVPADCTLILAAITGVTGLANGYETLTMPKGGVDTPMIRLPGGDVIGGTTWQAAMFYMVNPDTGASKDIKFDLIGEGPAATGSTCSLTFWKGVDTADPIRDSAGSQDITFPVETGMLTNREGDLVVTFYGGFTDNVEATVDSWKNATTLEQLTHAGIIDGAWATTSVIGSLRVGVETVTSFEEGHGAIVAAVLKPLAAVTPITPAADPPTTARTVTSGTFTLPPDLSAATTVEVIGESRSISVVAGAFTDTFDEEWSHHNYRIAIP